MPNRYEYGLMFQVSFLIRFPQDHPEGSLIDYSSDSSKFQGGL